VSDLWSELALFWEAFVASVVVATLLSFLGVFVLLRRMVFVGIALSQLAAAGCALAFLAERFAFTAPGTPLSLARDHWVMAAVAELAGLAFLTRPGRAALSSEARIGICWAAAGAAAVLLVAKSPRGMDELKTLLTGDILFVSRGDLLVVLAAYVPAAILLVVFLGRFLLVAFDREMAISLRVSAGRWDTLFFLILGVTVAVAIHLSGVLFTVGFLVLPGAAALSLSRRPGRIFGLAAAIGAVSAASGFVLSHSRDLPPGPTAVAMAFAVFAAANLTGRWRGSPRGGAPGAAAGSLRAGR
jgi:ABC-type Mn2+/Zn2+ transport system permease subunit